MTKLSLGLFYYCDNIKFCKWTAEEQKCSVQALSHLVDVLAHLTPGSKWASDHFSLLMLEDWVDGGRTLPLFFILQDSKMHIRSDTRFKRRTDLDASELGEQSTSQHIQPEENHASFLITLEVCRIWKISLPIAVILHDKY